MRKSDLHPSLKATAVPVPGHSGCYAVVPPEPAFSEVHSSLLTLAHREMQILADAVGAARHEADLLMHMLNRREAVDSSQIEGTHTQFDELLLHEIEAGTPEAMANADAQQTLSYLHAYTMGVSRVRTKGTGALDTRLICSLHGQLMKGNPRAVPGKLREIQNFIGGLKFESARFIPPPPAQVPRLMAGLDRLIRDEPDPESHVRFGVLTRAAVVHAHFEAIHPFVDGNGRVGRMLLPLMFLGDGEQPVHLATFLKRRQQEYYDALLRVQMRLDWSDWVELFLQSVIASCRHTVHLLGDLRTLAEQWRERLQKRRVRKHAAVWPLTDLLLGQPVVTVNALTDRLNVSFQAANAAVAVLVDMDILRPQGTKRRHRAFQAHQVMNLLHTGIDAVLDDVSTLHDYGTGATRRA